MSRTPLLLSLFFYLIYKLTSHFTGEPLLSLLVFVFPVGLLILNLTMRKSLRSKNWFLSSINILLEKKTYDIESEISTGLLFDKLLEVIEESEFQPLDTNKNSMDILCGTSTNFWTWGENIYIQLKEKEDEITSVQFVSTTLFGRTSWNRNEKNYESFIASFEASLTI